MEEKKKLMRGELTEEDMADFVPENPWNLFDYLYGAAVRSMEKFNNPEEIDGASSGTRKNKGKAPATEDDHRPEISSTSRTIKDGKRSPATEDYESKKKKKRIVICEIQSRLPRVDGPRPPPPLSEAFKNAIRQLMGRRGGEGERMPETKLVIQKALNNTDLSKTHNRMSMPLNNILNLDFLTPVEKSYLGGRDENDRLKYLIRAIIEPSLLEGVVKVSRWEMPKKGNSNVTYVLNGEWNGIKESNGFEAGMVVQLWAFRDINEELCLALVNLNPPDNA